MLIDFHKNKEALRKALKSKSRARVNQSFVFLASLGPVPSHRGPKRSQVATKDLPRCLAVFLVRLLLEQCTSMSLDCYERALGLPKMRSVEDLIKR